MNRGERLILLELYVEQGWALLPLAAGEKKPRVDVAKNWGAYRLAREQVRGTFGDGCNVGVLLGEPSRGLVDVDLDCSEAIELAPAFLPDIGRSRKPRSHWIYRARGELPPSLVVDDIPAAGKPHGAVLVELRSTGRQTMIPPSLHPSGESVEWTSDPDEPLYAQLVDGTQLRQRVELLGAACLLSRQAGSAAARAWVEGGTFPDVPASVALRIAQLLGLGSCGAPPGPSRGIAVSDSIWTERVKGRPAPELAAGLGLAELRPGSWGLTEAGLSDL